MRSFILALAAISTFGAASASLAAGAPAGKFIHPADTNKDGFIDGPEMVIFTHPELAKPPAH